MLDTNTEMVLRPQIVQEALARELVQAVRVLGRQLSGVAAKVILSLASPASELADMNQLEPNVADALEDAHAYVGVQEEYLGDEWAALVLADAERFIQNEHMSVMPSSSTPLMGLKEGTDTADTTVARMAWLSEGRQLSEAYPALAEAVSKMHALPFELNGQCDLLHFCL